MSQCLVPVLQALVFVVGVCGLGSFDLFLGLLFLGLQGGCSFWGGCFVLCLVGEFDPGSGRTLAACLTHASRAERPFGVLERRTGE
jgi:hypothetical protein